MRKDYFKIIFGIVVILQILFIIAIVAIVVILLINPEFIGGFIGHILHGINSTK